MAATAASSRLREAFTPAGGEVQIDREAGVIRNVRILGNRSRNGYRYNDAAMDQARGLYEGMVVNLDHQFAKGDRRIADGFGALRDIHRDGEGIRGDLHYLTKHPLAEAVVERAERFPETFGLSHDAEGQRERIGNETVVTSVDRVRSVDVVSNPATNTSLFESERNVMHRKLSEIIQAGADVAGVSLLEEYAERMPEMAEMPVEMPMAEMDAEPSAEQQVSAAFQAILVGIINDESLDMQAKLKKLKEILKAQDQAVKTVSSGTPGASADVGEAEGGDTPAESSEAMESLRSEVNELRRLMESRDREAEVDAMLLAAGVSRDDLSKSQAELLESATTARHAAKLIESFGINSAASNRESFTPRRVASQPTGGGSAASEYEAEKQRLGIK